MGWCQQWMNINSIIMIWAIAGSQIVLVYRPTIITYKIKTAAAEVFRASPYCCAGSWQTCSTAFSNSSIFQSLELLNLIWANLKNSISPRLDLTFGNQLRIWSSGIDIFQMRGPILIFSGSYSSHFVASNPKLCQNSSSSNYQWANSNQPLQFCAWITLGFSWVKSFFPNHRP